MDGSLDESFYSFLLVYAGELLSIITKVKGYFWTPVAHNISRLSRLSRYSLIALKNPTPPVSVPKLNENPQYTNIVNEILDSEKKYIHYLQILNMIFLLPLKEAAKNDKALISDVELRLIFSYIETILNLHTLFCKELEDVVQNKEMDGVGNAFLKNWEFFKMYSSYVNGYNASLSTLAYCKHNYPAFDKFIEYI
eukprot:Phypoly_transcript_11913.p1 GENE.Phypoly_transcript_11913~~Phypoly_transcript_11913.p1  ORF type:complete len:207 (+),score=29.88 Phypoly_transcript_11913:38-622(+)